MKNPDVRVVGGRLAVLSAALTAREQGTHGGSSRRQIIDLLVRSRARNAAGGARRIYLAVERSIRPGQRRQHARHAGVVCPQQIHRCAGADRLVDGRYAEYAAQKLGPFVLENKASQLAGCR